jgi:hypothetical protein
MEAMIWSAAPMASTPRKPNKLTAARQRKGSARGSKTREAGSSGVSTRCRPAAIMDRSSPLTNYASFQPTIIFWTKLGMSLDGC